MMVWSVWLPEWWNLQVMCNAMDRWKQNDASIGNIHAALILSQLFSAWPKHHSNTYGVGEARSEGDCTVEWYGCTV